jgi:hypothetical protein
LLARVSAGDEEAVSAPAGEVSAPSVLAH